MENLETWQVDTERSSLRFTLRHIVIQHIRGTFGRWGGELLLHRDDPSQSRVRAWVELSSVETGAADRDSHVKSAEFFDVGRFPRAEFHSDAMLIRDDGTASLRGWLDLHGVGNTVELELDGGRTWTDPEGGMRSAYVARGKIDRQAFGLHWNQDLDFGGVVVGDVVEIHAELELVRVPYQATSFERFDVHRRSPAP